MSQAGAGPLPRTCHPTVWLWPGQVVYSGPALGLNPHSGAVWCLAVGVDGPLTVGVGDQRVMARTVLIPPRRTHQLVMDGPLVSCYLDPASRRSAVCRSRFRRTAHGIGVDHEAETRLLVPPSDDQDALSWLEAAAPSAARPPDPRILAAATVIGDDLTVAPAAAVLAAHVGMSESGFLHLFTREIGTTVRRYRMWCRLVRVGEELAAGRDLTTAAAEAGFASPSHLSDRFRSTFGLSPTRLLETGVSVRVPRTRDAVS